MAWTQVGNLKGPTGDAGSSGAQGIQGPAGAAGAAGAQGAQGTAGVNGATIILGTGAPGAGAGVVGDVYIDTANGNLYQKS